MGSAKAAVLPLPVMAQARTSRPARAGGMAAFWMGVGAWKPRASMLLSRRESRVSSVKDKVEWGLSKVRRGCSGKDGDGRDAAVCAAPYGAARGVHCRTQRDKDVHGCGRLVRWRRIRRRKG